MNQPPTLFATPEPCPVCHGKGWRRTYSGEKTDCDACRGTGEQEPVETGERYDPATAEIPY